MSKKKIKIESISIGLASPNRIKKWAERVLPNGKKIGEVTSSKTVNYKTLKPEKDGLFCERIFGPVKDFECACGTTKIKPEHQFCPICEVEFTASRIRRYRLGYIELQSPVTHIWYLKGRPSYLSLLLKMPRKKIESIAYYIDKFHVPVVEFGKKYDVNNSKKFETQYDSQVIKQDINKKTVSNLNNKIKHPTTRSVQVDKLQSSLSTSAPYFVSTFGNKTTRGVTRLQIRPRPYSNNQVDVNKLNIVSKAGFTNVSKKITGFSSETSLKKMPVASVNLVTPFNKEKLSKKQRLLKKHASEKINLSPKVKIDYESTQSPLKYVSNFQLNKLNQYYTTKLKNKCDKFKLLKSHFNNLLCNTYYENSQLVQLDLLQNSHVFENIFIEFLKQQNKKKNTFFSAPKELLGYKKHDKRKLKKNKTSFITSKLYLNRSVEDKIAQIYISDGKSNLAGTSGRTLFNETKKVNLKNKTQLSSPSVKGLSSPSVRNVSSLSVIGFSSGLQNFVTFTSHTEPVFSTDIATKTGKLKKKQVNFPGEIKTFYPLSCMCVWKQPPPEEDDSHTDLKEWSTSLWYLTSFPFKEDILIPFYFNREEKTHLNYKQTVASVALLENIENISSPLAHCFAMQRGKKVKLFSLPAGEAAKGLLRYKGERKGEHKGERKGFGKISLENAKCLGLQTGKQFVNQMEPRNRKFDSTQALSALLQTLHLGNLKNHLEKKIQQIEIAMMKFQNKKFLYEFEIKIFKKVIKKRLYTIRRFKLVRHFLQANLRPEWMLISILPVLPPNLRPIIQLDGNQVAVSDLNKFYQRILFRNRRIKRFRAKYSDSSKEMKYAHRLLQEAVDSLIENGKAGTPPVSASNGRPLKSLSDILKGKKGRFRQNLLGKRVDYSGRSVIVVAPELKLHECGLPKEMAIVLFQPFLIRKLRQHHIAPTIIKAKKLMQKQDPVIWATLRHILKSHPILLNRAPTLHRLGIQAFQPKLVNGKAILLHPLVCTAFNADFDGDQMAVHVPLSIKARAEAWKLMWSRNNILSPATGQPIIVPSQDMVLGCYYLTTTILHTNLFRKKKQKLPPWNEIGTNLTSRVGLNQDRKKLTEPKRVLNKWENNTSYNLFLFKHYFSNLDDVLIAFQQKKISLHSLIWVRWKNKIEIDNFSEKPVQLRIDCYGNTTQIYSMYWRSLNKQDNQISQFIRTTAGRVILNKTILQHIPF